MLSTFSFRLLLGDLCQQHFAHVLGHFAALVGVRHFGENRYGISAGITHIVGGMCETDYSGYPDCRDETIRAMQVALSLGMARNFELHTPLMWIDKAATWQLAQDLGGDGLVDLIREHSHTCYLGERGAQHDWGYGCGECPACSLRAKGWREFVAGR